MVCIDVTDIQLDRLRGESLGDCLAAFNALVVPGGDLPVWPGIDFFLQVPPSTVHDAIVMKVGADLSSSRYIFWGSGLRWVSGEDLTGKSPLDIGDSDVRQFVITGIEETLRRRGPYAYLAQFSRDEAATQHRELVLRLPFLDEDGDIGLLVTFTELADKRDVSDAIYGRDI